MSDFEHWDIQFDADSFGNGGHFAATPFFKVIPIAAFCQFNECQRRLAVFAKLTAIDIDPGTIFRRVTAMPIREREISIASDFA